MGEENLATNVLTTLVSWCGAIGAIVLVVFLIKDIISLTKGDSNILSVIWKVICIFLVIGIMFALGSFEVFGQMFANFFEGVVTEENLPDIGQR